MSCDLINLQGEAIQEIGKLGNYCFNYDYVSSALTRVHEFYSVSKSTEDSSLMVLSGETGVGKTTIVNQFCRQVRSLVNACKPDWDIICLQVPASCTPKALATELLVSFGDPAADKGTMPNMTRRVINYLNRLEVSLVVLDEFQHLIETKSEKVLYATADWLKSVTNEVTCSFLLTGLPSVEDVIEANPQLKRRVISRLEVKGFALDTGDDLLRVQTILGLFSEKLPFKNAAVIASETFVRAIHAASGGVIGPMVNILKVASMNAIRDNATYLAEHHFRDAAKELAVGKKLPTTSSVSAIQSVF